MAYAAKDVHGGIIVTEPLCSEDFCKSATKHVQSPAIATVRSMYLDYLITREIKVVCDFTSYDWTLDDIAPESMQAPGLTTRQTRYGSSQPSSFSKGYNMGAQAERKGLHPRDHRNYRGIVSHHEPYNACDFHQRRPNSIGQYNELLTNQQKNS